MYLYNKQNGQSKVVLFLIHSYLRKVSKKIESFANIEAKVYVWAYTSYKIV